MTKAQLNFVYHVSNQPILTPPPVDRDLSQRGRAARQEVQPEWCNENHLVCTGVQCRMEIPEILMYIRVRLIVVG